MSLGPSKRQERLPGNGLRAAARPKGRPRRRFNLRKAMFVLPNLFTLSSIFCGFYAITQASGTPSPNQLTKATLAIFFGIFFDMADGRVARLTRTQSDFGMQLDSLADCCTFGVAPAVIVHKWGLYDLGMGGTLTAFLYVACGALRLARFNVLAASNTPLAKRTDAKKWFMGLPIPLAAGVLMSLVMFYAQNNATAAMVRKTHIVSIICVLSYLMISNVRYRAFKDVPLNGKSLTAFFGALGIFSGIAWLWQPAFALLVFFSVYVVMGLFEEVFFFRRRRREAAQARQQAAKLTPPEEASVQVAGEISGAGRPS